MTIVRRDNHSLHCIVLTEDVSWEGITAFLDSLRQEYEKDGWMWAWDDERIKKGLHIFRESGASYTITYYWKRRPRRGEFVW